MWGNAWKWYSRKGTDKTTATSWITVSGTFLILFPETLERDGKHARESLHHHFFGWLLRTLPKNCL